MPPAHDLPSPSGPGDTPERRTRAVVARCLALGFAGAGVSRATPTRRAADLDAWLAAGRHGEMAYLSRYRDTLVDPDRLLPGARSIVCVADRYHDGAADPPPDPAAAARGRVARYARGDDYHRVIRKRLHALCDELAQRYPDDGFRACVDTAPILEREYAERAGLGAVGKHTLLIERGVGSYLLLGEIVTTLDLAPTGPAPPDPCGTCTRCIDACPTGAIAPWSVDATRCISYLTIEHRTAIDPDLAAEVGDWLFGCDVCQEVCPHNQPTSRTTAAPVHPAYAPRNESFALAEVLAWSEDDRRAACERSALKRAKLVMFKRNALIVAGNRPPGDDGETLSAHVRAAAEDAAAPAMVRSAARAALARRGAADGAG